MENRPSLLISMAGDLLIPVETSGYYPTGGNGDLAHRVYPNRFLGIFRFDRERGFGTGEEPWNYGGVS
jgi:hypothetical protein